MFCFASITPLWQVLGCLHEATESTDPLGNATPPDHKPDQRISWGSWMLRSPMTYPEQLAYQWITPGVLDLLRRAQDQQIASQINGNPGGSWMLRRSPDVPRAAHGSMDFTGCRGSPEESAEPADHKPDRRFFFPGV